MKETKTLLVDMDGVLADFDGALYRWCADKNIELDITAPSEQSSRWLTDHVTNKFQRKMMRNFIQSPGFFSELEPLRGAIECFVQLEDHFDVWICTKPLDASPTCADEKRAWVNKYLGKEWVAKTIITPHKGLVRGDILLDDAPKIPWIEDATWKPVIFPHPWNGEGSKWESFDRWSWGDDIAWLI